MSAAQIYSSRSKVDDVEQLEEMLSEPTEAVMEALSRLDGDLLVLGVGGKMGPTLARMARRAIDAVGGRRRVIGVSRFSESGLETWLNRHGVETICCDLLKPEEIARLPDAANIVFMAGMKFGSSGRESLTWAMNAHLPALICQRYRSSRVVAFSTGNIYGLTPTAFGGSLESDPLCPLGEYAMSCVGRERLFEHFSRTFAMPMAILRLNYATELRYGVLVDLARQVWTGQTIDLAMGQFNALWQGDANAMALACFAHLGTPPLVLNLAGPEQLSVRRVAEQFGELLDKPTRFRGSEASDALLSNGQRALRLFGYPRVGARQMLEWIADWVRRGGADLGKPTHFDVRNGQF